MPFCSSQVLRGKSYTKAANIYSFGMVMYFGATIRQPFANYAHDNILALKICNGIRPEINELEALKCYIDLMKRRWDPNPDNRPNAIEIQKNIEKELNCLIKSTNQNPQAHYTSRLLNPFTKDLSKCDDVNNISVEIIDFTKLD
ncbi:kinase-like domain-containing protein [Rhizophagus clarus]|uniref:Kinase-like domain-containing protein n=1 Tax=Rhizophagus clarus TaxID=94130 RepID=A0A8H3QJI4_9GLOM|nr:kinase-like domain-containing protein [Rhizophagus clarus]